VWFCFASEVFYLRNLAVFSVNSQIYETKKTLLLPAEVLSYRIDQRRRKEYRRSTSLARHTAERERSSAIGSEAPQVIRGIKVQKKGFRFQVGCMAVQSLPHKRLVERDRGDGSQAVRILQVNCV
jgi:hypothetical protein